MVISPAIAAAPKSNAAPEGRGRWACFVKMGKRAYPSGAETGRSG